MRLLAPSLLFYLSLLLDDLLLAQAIRLPLVGRMRASQDGLTRRASIKGTPDFTNSGNMQYRTNVTLNGRTFEVLVDTGSSDLWVAGDVPGAKDTGKTGQVRYAIGNVKGPIKTADMDFEGFVIPDQAYIAQPVDSKHDDGDGILGLGPGYASEVQEVLGAPKGNSVLDRIFRQNTSTPNFISVVLGRAGDPTDNFPGDITVGELVPGLEDIVNQPKLPVTELRNPDGQHWTSLLDKNGIIGPDGQNMITNKKSTGNRYNVMFDTGFSFPQVPPWVAENIYGRVPGALFQNFTGATHPMWTLPCETELNVTFMFAGHSFLIHPLDTVSNGLQGPPDENGNPTCVGAFQPIFSKSKDYDMILGMSFLRNAYLYINLGDFVDGSLAKVGDPYIQLLSITEPAEAHSDFVTVRTNGIDRTADLKLLPAIPPPKDDSPDPESDDTVKKYLPYIIAGSVVAGVIVLILIFAVSFRTSRRQRYRRLNDPAPAGLPGQNPPFQQPQPGRRY